ncbi:MAG TPA: hypothetical protein VMB50_02130 [Myxococcales bacterium]|nr:hypothetical protein [Myxococcales bacterium]
MIRRLAAILSLLLAASPALAAQVTHVATAATDEWPVEIDLTPGFSYVSENATISREEFKSSGGLVVGNEMAYNRTTMTMPLRGAIGIWHHLELHFNIPIIIDDKQTWGFATGSGANETNVTVDKTPGLCPEGIPNGAGLCANLQPPTALASAPLVGANGQPLTSDRGGFVLGNVSIGIAWTPFNEEDDDTDPTWLVGFDYTAPTAALWDPSVVSYGPGAPGSQISGVGDKFHHFQPYTALSKRYGVLDPYIEVYADLPRASGGVYDNCDNPYGGAGEGPGNAGGEERLNCFQSGTYTTSDGASASYNWDAWNTQATPVYVGGFWFGSEFVAYENPKEEQKVAFDLRFITEYHSEAETYTEMTDLVRALTYQQDFARLGGQVGLYLRPTKYFMLLLNGSLEHDTDHWLTMENLGNAPVGSNGAEPVPVGSQLQNPNFDFRYDNPGDRFMLQNSLIWSFTGTLMVTF